MLERMLLCANGAWICLEKEREDTLINALRFSCSTQSIALDDVGQPQLYDWAVGSSCKVVIGSVTGHGFHINIMDGYRYFVQDHADGDDICLLGFRRCAYTVRSLCGFINKALNGFHHDKHDEM